MEIMIAGQIFGIVATIMTFISYQANTKRTLLLIHTTATLCTCLSFLFLGASTGFILNVVCLVRNVIYYFQDERSRLHYVTAGGLAAIMVVLGALSWQGWISLLMIVALAANTVFMSFGKPQLLRQSILATSTMVLIYNVFVFSLGGIANEGVSIVSAIVGIWRYRGEKKR